MGILPYLGFYLVLRVEITGDYLLRVEIEADAGICTRISAKSEGISAELRVICRIYHTDVQNISCCVSKSRILQEIVGNLVYNPGFQPSY